jgi:hypothetical protein
MEMCPGGFVHALERDGGRDAVALEVLLGIADARQHQKLRRVDDAACQDDLGLGTNEDALAVPEIFEARRLLTRPRRQRVGLDSEITAAHRRAQISPRCAAATAVADGHLPAPQALLLRTVIIFSCGISCRLSRFSMRLD